MSDKIVVIACEEDDFDTLKEQLNQQLAVAKAEEDSAIAIAEEATDRKNKICQALYDLIDKREKELTAQKIQELEENDAVKAYIETLKKQKTQKHDKTPQTTRKNEKIPCVFCGKKESRSHMSRHVKESQTCMASRTVKLGN